MFLSFLVWILILKDNADGKVFENKSYIREKTGKDKVLQICKILQELI